MENTKRKYISKDIVYKAKYTPFTWGDIKHVLKHAGVTLEDSDEIRVSYEPDEYDGSELSVPAYYVFIVTRKHLETDEEFNKRIKEEEEQRNRARKNRYELYLKLKQEFENDLIHKIEDK